MIPQEITLSIVEDLRGSCITIEEACYDHGIEYDDLEHSIIESMIFRCDACGWWDEISEMSEEDWLCTDCENDF